MKNDSNPGVFPERRSLPNVSETIDIARRKVLTVMTILFRENRFFILTPPLHERLIYKSSEYHLINRKEHDSDDCIEEIQSYQVICAIFAEFSFSVQ